MIAEAIIFYNTIYQLYDIKEHTMEGRLMRTFLIFLCGGHQYLLPKGWTFMATNPSDFVDDKLTLHTANGRLTIEDIQNHRINSVHPNFLHLGESTTSQDLARRRLTLQHEVTALIVRGDSAVLCVTPDSCSAIFAGGNVRVHGENEAQKAFLTAPPGAGSNKKFQVSVTGGGPIQIGDGNTMDVTF